jgi:hypothetical protein
VTHEFSYRVGHEGSTFVHGRRSWVIRKDALRLVLGVSDPLPGWPPAAAVAKRIAGRSIRLPWVVGLLMDPALRDPAVVQAHAGYMRLVTTRRRRP